MAGLLIKDGEYTVTVYRLIRDGRYGAAVQILSNELQSRSRAGLSLLGYCYFQMHDFVNAAECYEQLTHIHPEVEEYKLYYAQCLYKACMYPEAMKSTLLLDSPSYHSKKLKLQAAIKYSEEDLCGAKSLVEQLPADDPDTDINMGCILYKDGQYEEASKKFISGIQVLGYKLDLSYNIAVCYYKLKNYPSALSHIANIIECGIKDHPEFSVCMQTDGIDLQSVGNTLTLHETGLIEACNLKAAIQYNLNNYKPAQEALTEMPPRSEAELDPVTLHNQALMFMDSKPTEGFEKLQFLLQQNPFPPETFANLLILCCKYEYFDLAADVLAENAHLTHKFLSPYLYNFLDAMITCQTSPEEAFVKFDEQAGILTERLQKIAKQVEECTHDKENVVQKAVEEYDETLDKYVPLLMAQAKIYWNLENYQMVERIFRKSVIYCEEHDVWKLNVAHVMFMQKQKTKETIGFYEAIVKKYYDNILNVSAIALANLCVSYIMDKQTEAAEELMKKIIKEEETLAYDDPDKKSYHLCIVNLVIGTHFCAKGNYDNGIPLVIKSLEPYNKKLGTDTWYYAKRCFLSLLESMSKHTVMLQDTVIKECIQFLEHCELYGKNIPAVIEQPLEERVHFGNNTVTYEARHLKALIYEVTEWNVYIP